MMKALIVLTFAAFAAADLDTALRADEECGPGRDCSLIALQVKATSAEATAEQVAADADARNLLNARDTEETEDADPWKKGNKKYKKDMKKYHKGQKKYHKDMKKAYKKGWYLQEDEDQQAAEEDADARSLLNARDAEETEDADPWKKANKKYKKDMKKYHKDQKKAYKNPYGHGGYHGGGYGHNPYGHHGGYHGGHHGGYGHNPYGHGGYHGGYGHNPYGHPGYYLQEDEDQQAAEENADQEQVAKEDADARNLLNARDEEETEDADPWKKANKKYKKDMKKYHKDQKKYHKDMKKAHKKGWYLQEDEDQQAAEGEADERGSE